MAKREVQSLNCERPHAHEVPRGRFDPECGANGLPSRSAYQAAKNYAEASRPGQEENRGLEPLLAEIIVVLP